MDTLKKEGRQTLMETYFYQVPAVHKTILRATQDIIVFTWEAAVQFIALHLVPSVPNKWKQKQHA